MRAIVVTLMVPTAATLAACSGTASKQPEPAPEPTQTKVETKVETVVETTVASAPLAMAELEELSDSGVAGAITFTKTEEGLAVTGEVTGLAPGSTHGFHVHEKGDCSAPDGSSAGGHFNPEGHQHGKVMGPSHAGDLGNIVADEHGVARVSVVKPHVSLEGGEGVLGKAVIVHENADDLTSQPTGAAGGRIACGVIRGS